MKSIKNKNKYGSTFYFLSGVTFLVSNDIIRRDCFFALGGQKFSFRI